ncbi:MAG: ATP-binding protein [Clostridiaceae bacterium]
MDKAKKLNNTAYLHTLITNINKLVLYRSILKDEITILTCKMISSSIKSESIEKIESYYYEIANKLISEGETEKYSGDLWKNHLVKSIILDENSFSLMCEKTNTPIHTNMYNVALKDFEIIKDLYNINFKSILNIDPAIHNLITNYNNAQYEADNYFNKNFSYLTLSFEKNTADTMLNSVMKYYSEVGCGIFARYPAFYYDEGLVGVQKIDNVYFKDLIGIEEQKKELINNTNSFINGIPSNNVLLYGDIGTGKSSSIKALINQYQNNKLRLIELSRHQIRNFHNIINTVKNRGNRFIIFMDDLSFEEFETDYKYLKSVMEGGILGSPENVLIYATTNRKHILNEKLSERGNPSDELHVFESMQEKLSLVDRFGVSIFFPSPNQVEYLKIVESLAIKNKINVPINEIKKEALKWEMWHNGKSGRSANQFIHFLLSKNLE